MRRTILAFVVLLLAIPAAAQKISKPTKQGKEPTEAQMEIIREGISLHDEQKYDDALRLYEKVLQESPDCVFALYEAAYSLYAKGDLDSGLRYALKASEYQSELLPRIYMMIANIADDKGEPKKAIDIYKEAIKQQPNLSVLRYNIAITYFRLKNVKEGKEQVKKAIELDFGYESPHYLLSAHFSEAGYKIPSLIAALRFLSLEANTDRARRLAEMVAKNLDSGATRDPDSGDINIMINTSAPTDEGDFSTVELMLSMKSALRISGDDDKEKAKSRGEKFVEALEMLLSSIGEDKKNRKTFVGKNYFPYLAELKEKGYADILGHIILVQIGSEDSLKWLGDNESRLNAFSAWARNYGTK